MRWRVRNQLLLPLFLMLLGVAAVSVWMAITAVQQARRQVEDRMRSVAQYLSEDRRYPLSQNILLQVKRLSGADYLLVPQEGEALTTLEISPGPFPPARDIHDHWDALQLGQAIEIGQQTFLCSGFLLHQGPNAGDVLYILYPEELWRDTLWQAVWPFLVLGGSFGAASLGLALGMGRRLVRRLQEMERRTRLIAAGDFSPMPLPAEQDEIRELTQAINEMASRLAQLQETVKSSERYRLLGQVSGGIAHQLRNGLTGARLAVQLYLRENSSAGDTSPLEVALRQLRLLETSVKRFLDLGRSDGSEHALCDLGQLVRDTIDLVQPGCRHANIRLVLEQTISCTVQGDPSQLGQLLLNLTSNAVEAAGPGGDVLIRMRTQAEAPADSASDGIVTEWVVLEVLDSGPGPAREVADRIFEPFVTSKREGVGLGLALARQVVSLHGGTIGWSRTDKWTCFQIFLPCHAEAQATEAFLLKSQPAALPGTYSDQAKQV